MVTRRAPAASRAASAASATTTSSISDGRSRHASFFEVTQKVGGLDTDSERPVKIARRLRARCSSNSSQTSRTLERAASCRPAGGVTASSQIDDDGDGVVQPSQAINGLSNHTSDVNTDSDVDFIQDSIEDRLMGTSASLNGEYAQSRVATSHAAEALVSSRRSSMGHTRRYYATDIHMFEKHEPGDILKRIPGRRRATHPNPRVEANLRRQLELRVAYRAVFKALKPVLAELSSRTVQALETNPSLHEQYREFDEIQDDLDVRLVQRLALLERQLREENSRLGRMFEAGQSLAVARFKQRVCDTRDDCLLHNQSIFMTTVREMKKQDDSDATDDEDGLIPQNYRSSYPDYQRTVLEDCYDSRSSYFIRTQRFWEDFELRYAFRTEQREHDETFFISRPKDFAVYDGDQRQGTIAVLNLSLLANAAEDVEQTVKENPPSPAVDLPATISNSAATGLQALAHAMTVISSTSPNRVHGLPMPVVAANVTTPAQSPLAMPEALLDKFYKFETPLSKSHTLTVKPRQLNGEVYATTLTTAAKPLALQLDQKSTPSQPFEPRFLPPRIVEPSPCVTTARSHDERCDHHPGHFPNEPTSNAFPAPNMISVMPLTSTSLQDPPNPASVQVPAPSPAQPPTTPATRSARPRPRKRPGPSAIYATPYTVQYAMHPQQQDYWSPFTNTMGPPMFLPKYVRGSELKRQNTASHSPTSPLEANPVDTIARELHRLPVQDPGTRLTTRSPSRTSHQLIAPAISPMRTVAQNVSLHALEADNGHPRNGPTEQHPRTGLARPRVNSLPWYFHPMQSPTFLQNPHHPSLYYHPNNFYGPFQNYLQHLPSNQTSPLPYIPVQSQLSAPFSQQNFLPQSGNSFSPLTPPSRNPQTIRPAPGSLPIAPKPSKPVQSIQPRSKQQSQQTPGDKSMPVSAMLQHTGQTGHQPILPATMDPRRMQNQQLPTTSTIDITTQGPLAVGAFYQQPARIPPTSAPYRIPALQPRRIEPRRQSNPNSFHHDGTRKPQLK